MGQKIISLQPKEFDRCADIWNMERHPELAERFYKELCSGNRVIYVYQKDGDLLGEIALVYDMHDPDYTIENQRAYVSHLVVKKEYRRQGIGNSLVAHVVEQAKRMGLRELSIGVDLNNFAALKLYIGMGFDKVIFIGEDAQGCYVKLLKTLS